MFFGRFGQKHVLLLDCPVQLAKEVIVGHVQGVALPRRTHHYLISGLVSYVVKEGPCRVSSS
jgi:hypothetical protein